MKRLSVIVVLALAQAQAQPSRIELRSHFSPTLGTEKSYNIFLPEGYDADSLRYPAIYLFRGHEREWANPAEDASRRGNIKTVADALTATGVIGKMILVMPGMSQPGVDADFAYIANDLIPHIDATYRTIPVRQKRGMDGFSYGGYDVLQLLRRSPELFFTAGAYDGSFWVVDLSTFFNGTTEAYWALLRSMKFLLHSTPAGNWTSNLQFLSILASHGISNGFDSLALAPGSEHNWYFADMHMERSLPLHWQRFLTGTKSIPLQWVSPLPGSTVAGSVAVRWSSASPGESGRTVVDVSRDRGKTWHEAYTSTGPDTSFLWNTLSVEDGTGYLLRVRLLGDTTYGYAQMSGRFTVNNPGNAVPEVAVISPDSLQSCSAVSTVQWSAEDADGDPLTISIDVSPDNGTTWEHLSDPTNAGSYAWSTSTSPNSGTYRLRIRANDGSTIGSATSGPFSVYNTRPILQKSLVQHVTGMSDGIITVQVANSRQLAWHTYRVSFHDSLPALKTYTVADLDRNTLVLGHTPVPTGLMEGPLFDGLRLVLEDREPPRLSKDSTRWITGASNLIPEVTLPKFDPGTGMITGVAYVSDYLITVYDHTVDTSAAEFGWPPAPMNFVVRNVTKDHAVRVLFTDLNGDRSISPYDDLIILEKDSLGGPMVTWELLFQGSALPVLPVAGDRFLLKILKPFSRNDVYEFRVDPGGLLAVAGTPGPQGFELEQNYPNPFNGISNFGFRISEVSDVKLQVYDVLGREVATPVEGRKSPGQYTIRFNAGGLASGVYLYRLSAGGMVLTRKMLLLR